MERCCGIRPVAEGWGLVYVVYREGSANKPTKEGQTRRTKEWDISYLSNKLDTINTAHTLDSQCE